ncbi:MAG: pyridoxal-phosphate dependent enzyme [Gammaproteobacteria bacterium]|nr:pyridoxal-phosphate dependent enzyme [Gammaproteobacteria bacterium]MCW8924213.1 pyridoxal-phosphate dependent enzyme [Gammaproteobacteria bacterium]
MLDLQLGDSPLQRLQSPLLETAGVNLSVKREDLVDYELGGNKWRKMKYNLEAATQQNHNTLLTFGGAYSNHIYATAAAGKRLGLRTIGIIRGEAHNPLNPTLQFARDCGMQLEYLDRTRYRNKTGPEFIESLRKKYGRFYLLPEGGSSTLALKGCAEIIEEIDENFDFICSACGTGGTLAGLISGLKAQHKAIGFAVLKGGGFLSGNIQNFLQQANAESSASWQIKTDYHFGGYAKTKPELWTFIEQFKKDFDIPLDGVYTGKMFYGLFDLIKTGYFPKSSRIIAIHTGGLQGNLGFNKN